MIEKNKLVVGTSGYSFTDWVGEFYQAGTKRDQMFAHYVEHFSAVELNFTYYRLPTARTLAAMAEKSPENFGFWVKANQATTHKRDRSVAEKFLAGLEPLAGAGKLLGVLLQFPQSFHRTIENRKYLAAAFDDLSGPRSTPLAVEFRHHSWADAATVEGLRQRNVTLVVPDAPAIEALYHSPPVLTTATGYFRLHSRNADNWYAGGADRYDYDYSDAELTDLARQWSELADRMDRLFGFFNNCHHAQAARNAESFRAIVDRLAGDE